MLGPGVYVDVNVFVLPPVPVILLSVARVLCSRNTTATTKQTTIGGCDVCVCVCVCSLCVCVCVCVVLFLLVWRGVAPAPPRVFVDTLTSMSPLYPLGPDLCVSRNHSPCLSVGIEFVCSNFVPGPEKSG